jgi:DNA primase small subunit
VTEAPAGDPQDATVRFVWNRFRRYYASTRVAGPPEIHRREFAFTELGGPATGMIRPIGFRDDDALCAWLKDRVPANAYYSTAYYKDPTVDHRDKVWQGADLIFDLDADHVRGADEAMKSGGYAAQLALVKKDFIRLLDFLTTDFGYDPKEISIVFSGARGYHAHIRDPRVIRLGSRERREIVDYITAHGLDTRTVLREVPVGNGLKRRELVDEPGWGHRLHAAHGDLLRLLAGMDPPTALAYVFEILRPESYAGTDEKLRARVTRVLKFIRETPRLQELADSGTLDILPDQMVPIYLSLLTAYRKISVEGETDEPVTSDTKRIIRLPGSLHGKSGLACTALDFDRLAEFDPLIEAVPAAFRDDLIKVEVARPMSSTLRGQPFDLKPGPAELPEFAVVFFALRGAVAVRS